MTVLERFKANVQFDINTTCWLWIGTIKNKDSGYGTISINNKPTLAHRLSYILHKGEIGAKLLVCHSCDNPTCVNPEHLFLGTHKENFDDGVKKGRIKVGFERYTPLRMHPSLGAYRRGCRCKECKELKRQSRG